MYCLFEKYTINRHSTQSIHKKLSIGKNNATEGL